MALEVLSLLCTFENSLNCSITSFDSDSFPEKLNGLSFIQYSFALLLIDTAVQSD